MRALVLGLSLVASGLLGCGGSAPTPSQGDGGSSSGGTTSAGGTTSDPVGGSGSGGTAGAGGTGGDSSGGTGGVVAAGGGGSSGGTGGQAGSASLGGASGSGGAPPAYEPCPAPPEPCKIMPSGDSITVGAQSTETGGYRVPLFELALANTQNLTFVGPSGAGPSMVGGVPFPDAHDGHSGYVIDTVETRKGLRPLMQQNLTTHAPHVVLLMIGTNDVNSDVDLPNAPARFATLIDEITTTAPDTLLVVAKLIPTRTDSLNVDVEALNAAIASLVNERMATGKHLMLVDMYGAFTENPNYKDELLFDGLHPNDAGYAVMADVWYSAIGKILSSTP